MPSTSPLRMAGSTSFARTSRQLQCRLMPNPSRTFAVSHPRCPALLPRPPVLYCPTRTRDRSTVSRRRQTSQDQRRPPSDHHPDGLPHQPPPPQQSIPPPPRPTLPEARALAAAAYTPPTTGLLSLLPPTLTPYAELIRLDKPTGTLYLFLPCLFSTLLAAPLCTPIPPPTTLLTTTLLFLAGAQVMRGAGCTINDLWDRNLDPYVTRTRTRPLARGALTPSHALPFLGLQLLTGLAILLHFPPPCLFYATPSLLLVATYPLAKRFTHYPQAVLGLTFSWGAIMGFPALGLDLLSHPPALAAAACLYASCIAWTIFYDMIYAFQDIRDDTTAGIKSIALARQADAKAFLRRAGDWQASLLVAAGLCAGAGPAAICAGLWARWRSGRIVRVVDLGDGGDCGRWFRRGAWVVGGGVAVGLGVDYWGSWRRGGPSWGGLLRWEEGIYDYSDGGKE